MSHKTRKNSRKGKKDKAVQYDDHIKKYKIRLSRNYKKYERKRREEGQTIPIGIKKIKSLVPIVWLDATTKDIAVLVCLLDMVFRDHSYRVHVTYMQLHPGSVNMYGLKSIPSKSTLHNMAKAMADDMDEIADLLMAQAGKDAYGTLGGDATGFSIMRYKDWEDAKRGLISRREFDKLHILVAPHGKIVACEVTRGRAHDSPVFRRMWERIPDGTGDVLLDAAYLARKNCTMIAAKGRRPVICPKSNSVPRKFDAMGKMLRWHRDDEAGFDKVYRQRSLVENVFSSMKSRLGASARARTAVMRKLQLTLKCICYNIIA